MNNNGIINNNNYRRLEDLILLFKIHMKTRKNFFEIYGQCGHTVRQLCPTFCYKFTNAW